MKNIKIKSLLFSFILLFFISILIPLKFYNKIVFLNQDSFISNTEAKTFDIRQKFLSQFRKVSDEIVVISLDNGSFEFMTEKIGHWPMPRSVYVDMIDYVQSGNPKVFGIDILFTGAWNEFPEQDIALAKAFHKYDNLYSAIYFDDYPISKRKPINLPIKLSTQIINKSENFNPYHSNNVRQSYDAMLEYGNLGVVNIIDHEDGMCRAIPMFVSYPIYDENLNKIGLRYYPNISLKMLSNILNYDDKSFFIDSSNNLIINDKKIPMLSNSEVILNWYDKEFLNIDNNYSSFFESIPFKDVYTSMQNIKNGKEPIISPERFKDKIVLFGFTAETLFDRTTTPVEKYLPAVELYGIFINNYLDNSFIKKLDNKDTVVFSLFLLLFSFLFFYRLKSLFRLIVAYASLMCVYIVFTYLLMYSLNIWVPIIVPSFSLLLSFIVTLFFKYIVKSKDYEKLYTLVNLDDLTGLYNKRFFNEHMDMNIKYSLIYDKKFSLIIIDIDHFKKFNDTYGHLSGDCVLKQVAQVLKKEVGNKGVVCRYGGEEMCVILPQIENEEAHNIAQHLCDSIAKTEFILVDDVRTNVTISLGVCVFPDNATTIEKMVEYADKGLYYAKEHGRNQVGKSVD